MGLKTAVQQDREDRRCGGTEDSSAAGQGKHTGAAGRQRQRHTRVWQNRARTGLSGNPFQTLKLKMSEGLRENYTTSDRMDCGDPAQRTSPRTWKQCATERTYRIGDHRQRNDQPRRLIVTIHRWSDKMDIFTHTATPSDLHNSQMERQDGGFKRQGQGL